MQIRITSRYLLAAAIVERRSEFGWDQVELAEKAGLSQSVISTLERGANKSTSSSTLEKLESAMQWDEGTCERLLAAEEIDIYATPFPKRSEESQLSFGTQPLQSIESFEVLLGLSCVFRQNRGSERC